MKRKVFTVIITAAAIVLYILHSDSNTNTFCTESTPAANESCSFSNVENVFSEFKEEKIREYKEAKSKVELVPYEDGPIYTIFVHPIIVQSEKAFDHDSRHKYMNDWFVTTDEFEKSLNEMYERNYILIKTSDICDFDETDGSIKPKKLRLPKGKKPVIFSIDDLNYYPAMKANGTAQKLYVTEDGTLADAKLVEGELVADYGESIFILENFIKEHPDFSFKGARGVAAVTGYLGVLGYDTHKKKDANYAETVQNAKNVAEKLKEMGWELASHSYEHGSCMTMSAKEMRNDSEAWKNEVEPLIGKTYIYIYPFGADANSTNLKVLKEYGFRFFLSVGKGVETHIEDNYIALKRRALDGVLWDHRAKNDFLDVEKVFSTPRK